MRMLALDTASELCAACVWDSGQKLELGRSVEPMRTGHAERLMAVITAALEAGRLEFADVDRIAVSVGPGSFTGIRVAVAAARGLSLALGVPAVGVSTLEAIACEARRTHPGRAVLVVLGTDTGPLWAAAYNAAGELVHAPSAIDPPKAELLAASLEMPVLAGSATSRVAALLPEQAFSLAGSGATADIAFFAQLGAAREPRGRPVPLYLRAPDAKPQSRTDLSRRA